MKLSLQELDKLDPKIISEYRRTRTSLAIPEEIQAYIDQLDKAIEIKNTTRNISRAANKLKDFFPALSFETCRQRIYDAINKFHLNSTVKEEAWYNYYADFYEDIAHAALARRDTKTALSAGQSAEASRIKASAATINPDEFKPHYIFISPEVKAGRLGLTEQNLKTLWPDTKGFIKSLPIDEKDKRNAMNDAALALGEFAEFEDVEDDE